ncbi:MAG: chromosome segregation protein SMC [Proteobacteria bacterium]|nr:MAG: chromosome segregation protein SMC [Pseudomonadota bacterium]
MRLSKIKLAGFKSFVDSTEVLLPSNLTGVVGPNGCGKSNIIDAVRWVMGETSAKMLRGSAMTDVIFSGSATRKPVGMATVELIFDNSDGQIQGEYGGYNEISVKRQVNREAQSNYYLNGSKCRKKDIVDLFLGTGLGPRSYSIIEQGMISNIVESKPEDLRGYIEEAAGVSKYRERRRETERRILRTRENLERLDDLRTEVGKHIQHLKRQAKNAEKYTGLKQQSKQLKAEILALRWQQWHRQAELSEIEIKRLQTEFEKTKSGLTDSEKNITLKRDSYQQNSDQQNQLQQRLYQINGEIGKIEQAISHAKNLSEKNKQDLATTEHDIKQQQSQLQDDQGALQQEQQLLQAEQPKLETLEAQLQAAKETSEDYERAQQQWRRQWDGLLQEINGQQRLADVEKTKIASLEAGLVRQIERLNSRHQIDASDDISAWQSQLLEFQKNHEKQQQTLNRYNDQLEQLKGQKQSTEQQVAQMRQTIDNHKTELHQTKGQKGSLEALQNAALSEDNDELNQWLTQNKTSISGRLADVLKVASGWEVAVETVLRERLQALVSTHSDLTELLNEWQFGSITAVHAQEPKIQARSGRLAQQVQGPNVVIEWLNSVYTCDNDQQLNTIRQQLAEGESVITKKGDWFGGDWLTIYRGSSQENFLLRKKHIEQLNEEIQSSQDIIAEQESKLQQLLQNRQQQNQQSEQLQLDLNMAHRKLSELDSQIKQKQHLIEREQQQTEQKTQEVQSLKAQIAEDEQALSESRGRLEQALKMMKQQQADKTVLVEQQAQLNSEFEQAKARQNDISEQFYQSRLRHSAATNKIQSLTQNVHRAEQSIKQLQHRKDQLLSQLNQQNPAQEQQKSLDELIQKRIQVEQQKNDQAQIVMALQSELNEMEQTRSSHQQQIDNARTALENAKLQSQSQRLKADGFAEQLTDLGYEPKSVLAEVAELDQDLSHLVEQKETQMEQLHRNIIRLEPVNLAAIEEYEEESKRKQYLDDQDEDLRQALDTLEQAIARIDKDTRTLFKETFEAVNSHIKQLFPRLFGGGHAYLELTGHDLLTTGVTIMARPPGKRVSSIQLLSGGEKALTAVSLVFAIFNLNPAPFCLLDEVDAPLDDANVSRFSAMVKDMSEKVQFLFVTHNKVTMEIADQLLGVTMRESGVSRLVSVDLAAAAELVDD